MAVFMIGSSCRMLAVEKNPDTAPRRCLCVSWFTVVTIEAGVPVFLAKLGCLSVFLPGPASTLSMKSGSL